MQKSSPPLNPLVMRVCGTFLTLKKCPNPSGAHWGEGFPLYSCGYPSGITGDFWGKIRGIFAKIGRKEWIAFSMQREA